MCVVDGASLSGSCSISRVSVAKDAPGRMESQLTEYQMTIVPSDINGIELPSGNIVRRTSKGVEVAGGFLKVEFTSFTLYEKLNGPGADTTQRYMAGKMRDRIKKLTVTVGGQDYDTLTPETPTVVLPNCALPFEARLTMEYRGSSAASLSYVTDHPIIIQASAASKGVACCVVM